MSDYFSAFINEYPNEQAETIKKEMNAPMITSSMHLITSLFFFFQFS
jgi:hypothetical protein